MKRWLMVGAACVAVAAGVYLVTAGDDPPEGGAALERVPTQEPESVDGFPGGEDLPPLEDEPTATAVPTATATGTAAPTATATATPVPTTAPTATAQPTAQPTEPPEEGGTIGGGED